MLIRFGLIRLGICIGTFAILLFFYLESQNELTHLKIQVPQLEKKIAILREESRHLRYEVDQFENPSHLIELAHRPEFGHLKYPLFKEILTVSDAIASK